MGMISGVTCNYCDGDIECDEKVIAMVCPHCGNVTGVCANCRWYMIDEAPCGNCPFNIKINNEEN